MAVKAPFISKVKLPGGGTYTIKDALAWQALSELGVIKEVTPATTPASYEIDQAAIDSLKELPDLTPQQITYLTQINEAAKYEVTSGTSDIVDNGTKLTRAGDIKAYVDSQVGTIHKFDVVVDAQGTSAGPSLTANEENMYKLVLVQDADASAGTYLEYIVVRSGAEGSYTYKWEKIGSTKTDLTGYVPSTRTIATIDLQDNITAEELAQALAEELKTALDLGAFAYADKGKVSIPAQSITSTGPFTPAGTVTINALTQTATAANVVAEAYTPAGSITGSAISGGSIAVTVTDADSLTEAALTTTTYTPAGNVTGTVSVPNSAVLTASDQGVAVTGSVAAPVVTVTPATKTIKVLDQAGTNYTLTEGSVSQAASTKSAFNTDAMKAHMASGSEISGEVDNETLVFEAAATAQAVTAEGEISYNAPTLSGSLPTFKDESVGGTTASAEATAPAFTGGKFAVTLTNADANIDATFAATNHVDVPTAVNYYKQVIDTATFTGTPASLGFSGTEVANMKVTSVTYDKATANGASFTGTEGTVSVVGSTTAVDAQVLPVTE